MSFLLPALVCLNPQKLSIDFQKICEILAFLLFPFLLSTFISDLCDNWIRDETCHLLGYYYAASSGNSLTSFRDNLSFPTSRFGQVVTKRWQRITTTHCVTT